MSESAAYALDFTIEIDAAGKLARDDNRVDALITVTATASAAGEPAARNAEVLIMDRSRSMLWQNKMDEAKRAVYAAIDALPDGSLFGIVAGHRSAERVYPAAGGLAAVSAGTRQAAKSAIRDLRPEGGTEIGQWLAAARELFESVPAAGVIRHAVLYSDGKNEHETRASLDATLSTCTDRFVCDVRGLGDDWNYDELLHIAQELHGDATAVLQITDLAGDFTELMRRVGRLIVPRAYLRLIPDPRFEILSVEQVRPVHVSLPGRQPAGGQAIDIPLGSWAEETRLYRVSLRFDPASLPLGEEVRATPVELRAEDADGKRERRADLPFVVRRHDVPGRETERPQSHTAIEKMTELTVTIRACVDAWLTGQVSDADAELDVAIRLAREIKDIRLRLLEDVAEFGPDGRARLRADVTPGEMGRLGLDSRKSDFRPEDRARRPPPMAWTCRQCSETTYAVAAKVCEACGVPFGEEVSS